jgi:hypothetical protein
MAKLDLVAELTGTLQGLSPLLATKHIDRAWQDIQNERRWSFLVVDGAVVCPVMITAGAFNITQFSPTITADATASAALTPYITGTPLLTQLQIRFGGSNTLTAGQIYRIMAVSDAVPTALVLTLDRMVVEPTNATSTFQCYRSLITPPQDNFLAWDQIVDMTYGFKLRLNYTSGMFDTVDPQRTSQGDAYYCGFARAAGPYGNSNTPDPNQEQGAPIYELWPAPTQGRTYYVRFNQKGWDLSQPQSTQPAGIDDQMILQRAYGWYAYPFAQANASNFPQFKNSNWLSLIQMAKQEYRGLLTAAKRNDDAKAVQNVWNRGHGLRGGTGMPFPIDASFIQSHLLNF